jgi:hypothetical protein
MLTNQAILPEHVTEVDSEVDSVVDLEVEWLPDE